MGAAIRIMTLLNSINEPLYLPSLSNLQGMGNSNSNRLGQKKKVPWLWPWKIPAFFKAARISRNILKTEFVLFLLQFSSVLSPFHGWKPWQVQAGFSQDSSQWEREKIFNVQMIQAEEVDMTLTALEGPHEHPWNILCGQRTMTPARHGPLPHLTVLPEKQVVEHGVGLGSSLEENRLVSVIRRKGMDIW